MVMAQESRSQTVGSGNHICKPSKDEPISKPKQSTQTSSSFDIPLIQAIQQNFTASSLFANLVASPPPAPVNSPAYSSKTNDTATTADSTATAPSYESFDKEKKSEFACWLASQEFDASAIVTTEDDAGGCKDVNISGISDESHAEPPPLDDDVARSTPEAASKKEALKNSSTTPVADVKEKKADAAEQTWWPISEIQALLEKFSASDSCSCLAAGAIWQKEEATASEKEMTAVKVTNDISESDFDPSSKINQSTSFVMPNQEKQQQQPRSPLQSKVASTPVETCGIDAKPQALVKPHVSPLRTDYLEGDATARYTLTDHIRSPSINLNPSALTCQTADTPLAGLALVSTPLAGENYHISHEHSMMSKASSHLFGEDIVDSQQADYIPPPPHLLPLKMPQKELLFTSNKQDYKLSSTSDLVFELTTSKSQEGSALGIARNEKLLKRVRDKRRQRRNGQV